MLGGVPQVEPQVVARRAAILRVHEEQPLQRVTRVERFRKCKAVDADERHVAIRFCVSWLQVFLLLLPLCTCVSLHPHHLEGKGQLAPGQGVVGVEGHLSRADSGDAHDLRGSVAEVDAQFLTKAE